MTSSDIDNTMTLPITAGVRAGVYVAVRIGSAHVMEAGGGLRRAGVAGVALETGQVTLQHYTSPPFLLRAPNTPPHRRFAPLPRLRTHALDHAT